MLPPPLCKNLKHSIWWTAKISLHLKCRTLIKQRNVGFLNRSRFKYNLKRCRTPSLVLEKLSRILLHTITWSWFLCSCNDNHPILGPFQWPISFEQSSQLRTNLFNPLANFANNKSSQIFGNSYLYVATTKVTIWDTAPWMGMIESPCGWYAICILEGSRYQLQSPEFHQHWNQSWACNFW